MKAFLFDRYGPPDVLTEREVESPAIAADDDVLVRIEAAATNALDWHFLRGRPYLMRLDGPALLRPKERRLGVDLAGRVEAVGPAVTRFRPGDEVFGWTWGAYAEVVATKERKLLARPAGLSAIEAAAIPTAATTALQGLRDVARLQAGQDVLVIGASGGVGTFAVQIAKALGARHVTGVCHTRNVDLVRSLGADDVVDYASEDPVRRGRRYDVIFQLAGTHSPLALRRALAPDGTLVLSSGIGPFGGMDRVAAGMILSRLSRQRMPFFLARLTLEDLEAIVAMIEAGTVRPVIERTYPLAETQAAIAHIDSGHTRGKVLTVA